MAGCQRSISLSTLAAYDNQLILCDITKENKKMINICLKDYVLQSVCLYE